MEDERTKRLQRQLGVEIGQALDKAEAQGEQRVFLLLEAAYALAALEGWTMRQLVDRSVNRWQEQLRRDTAGQLIQVVNEKGDRLH